LKQVFNIVYFNLLIKLYFRDLMKNYTQNGVLKAELMRIIVSDKTSRGLVQICQCFFGRSYLRFCGDLWRHNMSTNTR